MDVAKGSPPGFWREHANLRVKFLRAFAVIFLPLLACLLYFTGSAVHPFAMICVLLAILIPWFGIRIRELRFRRNRDVQLAADKDARERYLLGLAMLAAGAAQEMGTPLSTMAFLVGDLRRSDAPPPDWKESVEVLWQQIQECKQLLSGLAAAADAPGVGGSREVLAKQRVLSLVERMHLLRPEVSLQPRSLCTAPDLMAKADLTLPQALPIERLGGRAMMLDRKNGGARVQVELPAFRKVA